MQQQTHDQDRAEFETWITQSLGEDANEIHQLQPELFTLEPSGTYFYNNLEEQWQMWQETQVALQTQLRQLTKTVNRIFTITSNLLHLRAYRSLQPIGNILYRTDLITQAVQLGSLTARHIEVLQQQAETILQDLTRPAATRYI